MLDIKVVEDEIDRLEGADCTSYANCEKLAWLYIVREHFGKDNEKNDVYDEKIEGKSYGVIISNGRSEFYKMICNMNRDDVVNLFDKFMSRMQVVSPSEYDVGYAMVESYFNKNGR